MLVLAFGYCSANFGYSQALAGFVFVVSKQRLVCYRSSARRPATGRRTAGSQVSGHDGRPRSRVDTETHREGHGLKPAPCAELITTTRRKLCGQDGALKLSGEVKV